LRQRHPAEAAGVRILHAGVRGQLATSPEHQRQTAGLEEDGLLDLLAAPAEPLVEGPRPGHVGDAEGDEADPLLHRAAHSGAWQPASTLLPSGSRTNAPK